MQASTDCRLPTKKSDESQFECGKRENTFKIMRNVNPRVSVIVPTMAAPQRIHLLKRAVDSIRRSSQSFIRIIVVVNGNRFDHEACAWLRAQPDIQFEYVEEPSAPKAILKGRGLVTSEFFSTLDDDDEYLEGATDDKLHLMDLAPNIDLVVANGFEVKNGVDTLFYSDFKQVSDNPLQCLMNFNWLHNCNALYRTASFDIGYFADSHPYAEWTWLAFKCAMANKRIEVLQKPAFRYHDTIESLSKSAEYRNAAIPLFRRMLECGPPTDIAHAIQKKMGAAWHDASDVALKNGRRNEAFKCHLKSLLSPGGSRYLSFSRHFFMIHP